MMLNYILHILRYTLCVIKYNLNFCNWTDFKFAIKSTHTTRSAQRKSLGTSIVITYYYIYWGEKEKAIQESSLGYNYQVYPK